MSAPNDPQEPVSDARMGLSEAPTWTPDTHLVLWDGVCGFCARSVAFLLGLDEDRRLTAMPYQVAPQPPMTEELEQACIDAVHVVKPDGEVLRAGLACVHLLHVVGYPRTARVLGLRPILWCVERGYAFIASHRLLVSRFIFRRIPTRIMSSD